jgi:hypothetical protein
MILDGPVVAGWVALLLFRREGRAAPVLVFLALLCLARETTVCSTAGVVLASLRGRCYAPAAAAAASVLPALFRWWFVTARTAVSSAPDHLLTVPPWPQFLRLFRPFHRGLTPALEGRGRAWREAD